MQKRKYYHNTRFPVNVVKKAHDVFLSKLDAEKEIDTPNQLEIILGDESWCFDTREEFLAKYSEADDFLFDHISQGNRLRVRPYGTSVGVLVSFPSRFDIESVFQVFERQLDSSKIVVESDPIKIFIGHGRDQQWRDLKDHLQDEHGFEVVAYEIGPRAGLSIKEVAC